MVTGNARLQFMESQAAHIESRARMIQHGSIQYSELVGISREASPYADSIVYYSYDGTGEMPFMANRGNDYQLVQVTQSQHTVRIEWPGLAYDYSDREIGRAMLTGVPLSDRKVRLAFRIWEELKDDVFINGNSNYGWDGIRAIGTDAGDFSTQVSNIDTQAEIQTFVRELNELVAGVWVNTNQVRMADTLLLTPEAYSLLAYFPYGNDANRTAMEFLRNNNVYTSQTGQPLMIRTLRQLVGAGGTNLDRAVAYSRDMDVLRMHIPMELQFQQPIRQPGGWLYPGDAALGGLEVMEPTAVRYMNEA